MQSFGGFRTSQQSPWQLHQGLAKEPLVLYLKVVIHLKSSLCLSWAQLCDSGGTLVCFCFVSGFPAFQTAGETQKLEKLQIALEFVQMIA